MALEKAYTLTEEAWEIVRRQIAGGRFATEEDVIKAGLQLLQEHEQRREALRKALQAGLDSGEARELDFDELFEDGEFDSVTGERLSA